MSCLGHPRHLVSSMSKARFLPHGLCRFCLASLLLASTLMPVASSALASGTLGDAMTSLTGQRPRIGLVLSGGGARGYAHIGILDYLEKHRIPVDYIAATSVGAAVGGLYASGMSASELKQRLATVNLDEIAFDHKARAQRRQSLREDDFKYPIGLSVGYGNGQLRLPSAIIEGTELMMLLQDWTARFPSPLSFDTLPTPFVAIATDLATGNEVILKDGLLAHAMRASMAVPGLFSAFRIGDKTLVDGGISSNLPIEQVRRMGADIIIAVNIGSPLLAPDALQSPAAMAQQMLGIFIQKNVRSHKARLTPYDILIEPRQDDVGFTDFTGAQAGMAAGWDAAQQSHARLSRLSLTHAQWEQYLQARKAASNAAPRITIDAIRINMHGSRMPPGIIGQELNVNVGDPYDVTAINAGLAKLANTDLHSVTQELLVEDGKYILNIHGKDKNWGPQFFVAGFGMSNNFNGRGNFNLQLGHRYPWMTSSGLAWYNDALVGTSQIGVRSEIRQSLLNTVNRWDVYIAPYLDYRGRYVDYYPDTPDDKGNVLSTQYRTEKTTAGIDIGIPLGLLGEMRTGINYQIAKRPAAHHTQYNTMPDTQASMYRQSALHAQLTIDQLDDPLFARHGYYLYTEANQGLGRVPARYNTLLLKGLQAVSYGPHTLNVAIEAARALEGSTMHSGFSLGGFQRLSVYSTDRFTGNYLAYARITYLNKIAGFQLPALSTTVLGSSLEAGNVWQNRKEFGQIPFKKNLALFVGGNSAIGPLYLGAAFAPRGLWNIYLQIGRVF